MIEVRRWYLIAKRIDAIFCNALHASKKDIVASAGKMRDSTFERIV
jgi:hypothetical protein